MLLSAESHLLDYRMGVFSHKKNLYVIFYFSASKAFTFVGHILFYSSVVLKVIVSMSSTFVQSVIWVFSTWLEHVVMSFFTRRKADAVDVLCFHVQPNQSALENKHKHTLVCTACSLFFLETSVWLLTPDHCYLQSSSFEVQQEVILIALGTAVASADTIWCLIWCLIVNYREKKMVKYEGEEVRKQRRKRQEKKWALRQHYVVHFYVMLLTLFCNLATGHTGNFSAVL